jgi:type I restriction enzyme S subunit
MYLGYFINSKRFRTQILPLAQGTKVSSISKSEIQKTSIAFPSFEVQSQIASMLYALDHRIDICQACVQGLVRTKEALLQQLFI